MQLVIEIMIIVKNEQKSFGPKRNITEHVAVKAHNCGKFFGYVRQLQT